MTQLPILIVDDEPDLRELLSISISRLGYPCIQAGSLQEAKLALQQNSLAMVFTDLNLPDGSGQQLVEELNKQQPELAVVVITAYGSLDTAITALKAGAFDFLTKPIDLGRIKNLIEQGCRATKKEGQQPLLLGDSPCIAELRQMIARLARNQAPIYVQGESGTGKELVARSLHQQGPRSEQPFIAVNCGAIPSELMESEFFGHLKGSFTGAHQDKQGFFQAAQGGTLFLDEIAELPISMQIKLLRAIQERAIRPVGGTQEIKIDIRLICATHYDLAELVEQGKFRQDLYYRLNVIQLRLPALREHPEDIPLLAEHMLLKLADRYQLSSIRLTANAIHQLQQHNFPGNVRELENILERAVALTDANDIDSFHGLNQSASTGQLGSATMESQPAGAVQGGCAQRPAEQNLDDWLMELEKAELLRALEQTGWHRTEAAKLLGISFRSLRYKLKKLALE